MDQIFHINVYFLIIFFHNIKNILIYYLLKNIFYNQVDNQDIFHFYHHHKIHLYKYINLYLNQVYSLFWYKKDNLLLLVLYKFYKNNDIYNKMNYLLFFHFYLHHYKFYHYIYMYEDFHFLVLQIFLFHIYLHKHFRYYHHIFYHNFYDNLLF